MKCSICENEVPVLFLGKLRGTTVRDTTGKRHTICFSCQKHYAGKQEELKKQLE